MFAIDDLLDTAGETIFGRGEDYVRYVHGLQVHDAHADASIQAKRVYTVRLRWSEGDLRGECSCPFRADGHFCKHLVAVGLAVLSGAREPDLADGATAALHDFLSTMAQAELVGLVEELMARDESVLRTVQARALAAGWADAIDPDDLVAAVRDTLPSGFVDYRYTFDVASGIQGVLDDLERVLDAGGRACADKARPALERAVKRLRQVILNADDSSGSLGDACQRAAELHARSCRDGRPDGAKLARWLAKFRADSPGWPDITLAMYADAFNDRALLVYRREVAKLASAMAAADHYSRFEVDRMQLELADHDGDVDEAVRLLSCDAEHVAYGAIIDRLDDAHRTVEALDWLDRAVSAGRVSHHARRGEHNAYWVAPVDAADRYIAAERGDDAIAILRGSFERFPGPESLRNLLDAGGRLSCATEQRMWAMTSAEHHATRLNDGSALIRIALADGDLVAAWAAVERFGAGGAWKELAEASEDDLPIAAAELYRPELDRLLRDANTRLYPAVAQTLKKMRALYAKVGEADTMDVLIAGIREQYRRRTSLIAQLDRAGLT